MERGNRIRKKWLVLATLTLLVAFSFPVGLGPQGVGATPEEVPRERTIIVDVDGRSKVVEPTNLNPFLPGVGYIPSWHEIVTEPLFIFNWQTGEFINWIGTGWEYSEDFTSCRVFIRKGVKWNDGRPFTADDIVFTYEMLLKYDMLVQHPIVKTWVDEVVKIDDHTVEFRLTKPFRRFHGTGAFPGICYIWGFLTIVPKHIWEKVDPTTFKNYPNPVFTGPYRVTYSSETEFIYDRRDDWWGTEVWGIRPAAQRIIWRLHTTDEMAAMAAARHELDSVMDISLTTFLTLKDKNPYMVAWEDDLPYAHVPHGCERYIEINKEGKYPLTLKEVRRAISYLTNREEIVRVAYEGTSRPSRAIFGQTGAMLKWLDVIEDLLEKYEVTEYNPEKAYAIFEGLGFKRGADGVWVTPNGTRLSLTVICPPWIEKMALSMVWVEQLKEGGIDAVQKVLESTPYGDAIMSGRYEAAAIWLCPMGTHEPYTYLESYGHSRHYRPVGEMVPGWHYNIGRFRNETYDYWIDVMGEHDETDPEYIEAFRKAYEIWLQEMPAIAVALCRKVVPFDTYYWVGWPTSKDPYVGPFTWCGYGLRISLATKLRPREIEYATVYFTKDTPREYRGIDLAWYGPFKSGDSTRLPVDDAEWYIRTGYASYTPVIPPAEIPPEIPAMAKSIETLVKDVSDLKTGMTGISDAVSATRGELEAIRGQTTMVATAAAVEGVAIIILAIGLVVTLRKKA